MELSRKLRFIIFALLICFNFSNAKGLRLTISSPDSVWKTGQNIPLRVSIQNISDSTITLPYSPYLQQFLETYAVCGKDTLKIEHPVYSLGHGRNPVAELDPGKSSEYPLLNKNILLDNGNYGDHVFYKPGIYKILCLYDNLRSNEVILKIIDTEHE